MDAGAEVSVSVGKTVSGSGMGQGFYTREPVREALSAKYPAGTYAQNARSAT
jgi:hypothetical protein